MLIKEAITLVAEELAPKGAEIAAEYLPKFVSEANIAKLRSAASTVEHLLPELELRSFSGNPRYTSNAINLASMEHLFKDSTRHELLDAHWSPKPTKFVDQWRYAVAPITSPLETNGLYTCTALSVTDRNAGLHYLAHIDSDTSVPDIIGSVSRFNFRESSVRILPGPKFFESPSQGIHFTSRTNVEKTVNALQQIPHALNDFKFLHSNESNYYSIVSDEGKLYRGSPKT
jgi:hypothetical protein